MFITLVFFILFIAAAVQSSMVSFTVLPVNNSVLAVCSPIIENSICILQYKKQLELGNFSSKVWLTNYEVNLLPILLNLNVPYVFKTTVLLSHTLKIMMLNTHYFYKETQETTNINESSCLSVTVKYPLTDVHANMYWIGISVVSVISIAVLVFASICIISLFLKGKLK